MAAGPIAAGQPVVVVRGLRRAARAARNPIVDLAAYPILTEEVGYPPSPLAKPSGGTAGGGTGTVPIGQLVTKAVSDVLGWKIKPGDSKGFIGALNQSFTLTEVEGHIESKWKPRTYAVQTDLAGGITGAQASIYSRGKEALDQSLPLLEGLYTLDPEADPEDVTALKAVVKSQLSELVTELGYLGGPRIDRVNRYFSLLLIDASSSALFPPLTTADPDQIRGTLGNLRDVLGLNFTDQDFVNSVDDERNLSNYRIMADYVTSLAQSWINNLPFLGLTTPRPFFGTQLVLLSRQLSVVAESVDEVRFTLDSVFIGPAERQTIRLTFPAPAQPIFLEDLLVWIYSFATEEGPRLIQDGGKFGVQNNFTPILQQFLLLVSAMTTRVFATNNPLLPGAFFNPRVTQAIEGLVAQIDDLVQLALPIQHVITPEPDFGLPFGVIETRPSQLVLASLNQPQRSNFPLFVRGTGFQATPVVTFTPNTMVINSGPFFRSENLLVVMLDLASTGAGTWSIDVTNADGSGPLRVPGGFTVT